MRQVRNNDISKIRQNPVSGVLLLTCKLLRIDSDASCKAYLGGPEAVEIGQSSSDTNPLTSAPKNLQTIAPSLSSLGFKIVRLIPTIWPVAMQARRWP